MQIRTIDTIRKVLPWLATLFAVLPMLLVQTTLVWDIKTMPTGETAGDKYR